MPQLLSQNIVTKNDMIEGAISANGKYTAYRSGEISTNNNKAIDAVMQIHSFLPNRQGLGKAKATLVLERKDDAGNWHPVHSLYSPVDAISYDETENGGIIPGQQLSYGPSVFNFDGPVSVDSSDGVNIISQDHQKRGVLPDKIRLSVIVHERDYGNIGAFESISFSLDYELRPE